MVSSVADFARDVLAVSRERQLGVTAAGLAFHAFNTLVPAVILLLVATTVFDGVETLLGFVEATSGIDTAPVEGQLEPGGAQGPIRATVLAFLILAWSGVRLFRAVNSAFTDVYDGRKRQSLSGMVVNVLLTAVTIVVAVGLAGIVGVSLSFVIDGLLWRVVSPLVLFVSLVCAFLPMYYLYPQTDVTVREVLPGTAFAAGGWVVLAAGFRLYIRTSEGVELYGIAGAVLIVLTWVYLGGLCILLGAVGNAVLAGRVEPDAEWISLRDRVRSIAD